MKIRLSQSLTGPGRGTLSSQQSWVWGHWASSRSPSPWCREHDARWWRSSDRPLTGPSPAYTHPAGASTHTTYDEHGQGWTSKEFNKSASDTCFLKIILPHLPAAAETLDIKNTYIYYVNKTFILDAINCLTALLKTHLFHLPLTHYLSHSWLLFSHYIAPVLC